METQFRVAAEFADDHWLLIGSGPGGRVEVRRNAFVPADVFIDAIDIEIGDDRIIKNLLVWRRSADLICGRRDQAARIEITRSGDKLMKKSVSLRRLGRLVADGPENDGGAVSIARDH